MASAHGTSIPLCDLQSQYRELQSQIEQAVSRVLSSGQVLTTAQFHRPLRRVVDAEPLGPRRLKGFDVTVNVYSLRALRGGSLPCHAPSSSGRARISAAAAVPRSTAS